MMGGFTLDLKPKRKQSTKKKRINVFGEEERPKKKTNVRLTHVDEYQEKPPKKLVIIPETLRSSLVAGEHSEKDKPKYGLIMVDDENQCSNELNVQEHINRDLSNRSTLPDITRDEEYEEVPVEEFGEAFLRGMGWDGKEDNRNEDDPPLPRCQFLGIGAKVLPNCNRAGNDRNKNHEEYMPVVKVDKRTGERAT